MEMWSSPRSSTTRLFPVFHQLLLPFDEFLGAVDAALVEHEIAYRRLDQHGEIPAGRDGNGHLADGDAENFLISCVDLEPVELGELLVAVMLEVDHELQQLARAHRGLAEDGADIEDTDSSHLEKVLEHRGTTSFERIRGDPVELDDVVRDQAVAARNRDRYSRMTSTICGEGWGDVTSAM